MRSRSRRKSRTIGKRPTRFSSNRRRVGEPAIEPDARTVPEAAISPAQRPTPSQTTAAYAVHVFTASGVICALLAAAEVAAPSPRPKLVFVYLAIQVLIDALDGPMARAVHIKVR